MDNLEGKGYKLLEEIFSDYLKSKMEPGTSFSRYTGNIYTGSLYLSLASYLSSNTQTKGRAERLLMFSYGSGAASTMYTIQVLSKTPFEGLGKCINDQLADRKKVSPAEFDLMMSERRANYGRLNRRIPFSADSLRIGAYFLQEIKSRGERVYLKYTDLIPDETRNNTGPGFQNNKHPAMARLLSLSHTLLPKDGLEDFSDKFSMQPAQALASFDKFYKRDIKERREIVSEFLTEVEKQVPTDLGSCTGDWRVGGQLCQPDDRELYRQDESPSGSGVELQDQQQGVRSSDEYRRTECHCSC